MTDTTPPASTALDRVLAGLLSTLPGNRDRHPEELLPDARVLVDAGVRLDGVHEPGPVTHIAGIDVQVGGRLRQRCAWCAALLVDEDLARVAVYVEPGQDPGSPVPTWGIGALVRVDGGLSCRIEPEPGEDHPTLPADFCGRREVDQ